MVDLKTLAVAPFSPDVRTFHNIYKLQRHVLLRHQSYLIVFMGSKNLRFWQIMPLYDNMYEFEIDWLILTITCDILILTESGICMH